MTRYTPGLIMLIVRLTFSQVDSSSGSSQGDDTVEESSDTELSQDDSDAESHPVRVRKGEFVTAIQPKSSRMSRMEAGKRSDSLVSGPSSGQLMCSGWVVLSLIHTEASLEPSEEEVDKVHKKYAYARKMPEAHGAESPEFSKGKYLLSDARETYSNQRSQIDNASAKSDGESMTDNASKHFTNHVERKDVEESQSFEVE